MTSLQIYIQIWYDYLAAEEAEMRGQLLPDSQVTFVSVATQPSKQVHQ